MGKNTLKNKHRARNERHGFNPPKNPTTKLIDSWERENPKNKTWVPPEHDGEKCKKLTDF